MKFLNMEIGAFGVLITPQYRDQVTLFIREEMPFAGLEQLQNGWWGHMQRNSQARGGGYPQKKNDTTPIFHMRLLNARHMHGDGRPRVRYKLKIIII